MGVWGRRALVEHEGAAEMGAKAVATETKPKKHRLAKFATYVSAASSILVAAGMTQASHVDEVFFEEQVRRTRARSRSRTD